MSPVLNKVNIQAPLSEQKPMEDGVPGHHTGQKG